MPYRISLWASERARWRPYRPLFHDGPWGRPLSVHAGFFPVASDTLRAQEFDLTEWGMEPRPKDKMPPNPIAPIVRAVVWNTIFGYDDFLDGEPQPSLMYQMKMTNRITNALCETLDQDHWDYSDRVRRASTKHTWGVPTDG